MLETVRQYAQEKLVEEGAADRLRRSHRDWCLALAERAALELRGPREEVWLERLETDHDNFRAALERSKVENEGAEAGLRLAGALHYFWWHASAGAGEGAVPGRESAVLSILSSSARRG